MSYYRYSSPNNYYRPSPFGGFRYFPPVIKALLVSNVAIYFLTVFFGLFRLAGQPLSEIIDAYFPLYPIGPQFHLWQLLTYQFMHGGVMHLLFNMFALWMFGMQLENDWGSRKFLVYYLLCGIGAGLSNLFIGPLFAPPGPTVGASGAIYGVLLAFGMMYPDQPIFVYFLLPIRARYFVLFYILLELYAGVTGTSDGVAHFAHLGGAAVGLIYILIDQRRMPFQGLLDKTRERFASMRKSERYPSYDSNRITDAKYYDLHDDDEDVDQQKIDEILDKISQKGYQSLTEREKKILFDASKKLN